MEQAPHSPPLTASPWHKLPTELIIPIIQDYITTKLRSCTIDFTLTQFRASLETVTEAFGCLCLTPCQTVLGEILLELDELKSLFSWVAANRQNELKTMMSLLEEALADARPGVRDRVTGSQT